MPYPTAIVSIAFNDGPYVASPTWTDVSSYVRSLSTDRSRDDDWGNFTGSASVALDNRSRIFDPFYTSGTYYGKLLPRRQIKIEASYGGTTDPVFRGYIDGWPPTWTDSGFDSTVTLQCYDALSLLSQVQLPADWSKKYILSLSPRHYYPCDDPIVPYGSNVMTDLGTVPRNLALNANSWASQQLAVGLVDSSLGGYGTAALDYIATSYTVAKPFTTQGMFSVSFWCIPDVQFSTTIAYGMVSGWLWSVGFDNNKFSLLIQKPGAGITNSYSWETNTQRISPSEPIHFAASVSAFNSAQLFINGVDRTGAYSTGIATIGDTYNDYTVVVQGPIQQIIVWDTYVAGYQYQEIIKYSLANFGETTAARISRIIAETPFPASLVNAAGTQSIGEITDGAPYAGPELQVTAQTEGAPLYVNRNGQIRQESLYGQFTGTKFYNSQTTYGVGGSALQDNMSISYDAASMRNALNVSMSQGAVVKTTGTVSTAIYGESSQDWTTYAPTYAQALLVGNVLVGFGQYVYPGFDDFEVVLSGSNNWSATLGLDLLNRVTVNLQPPTGNVITQDLQISSIKHTVVPGQWRTVLNGSARWASSFRLDVSSLDGPDVIVYTE